MRDTLGVLYAYQLHPTKAVKAFEEAERLEPNNAPDQWNLGGNLMLSVSEMKKGGEHLKLAKELNPALKDAPPK